MYKVIIVEDDPMVASINRQYLQANVQFQVTGEFRNGKEALEHLKKSPADLAVIDYYMPVMDGRKFILSCHEHQISLDFIMITAANSVKEIQGILKFGVIDYLVKPLTFERFQNALQKYMDYKEVLSTGGSLNQETIDRILSPQPVSAPQKLLEKGLQFQTLLMIKNCLARKTLHQIPDQGISSMLTEAFQGYCISLFRPSYSSRRLSRGLILFLSPYSYTFSQSSSSPIQSARSSAR